MVTNPKPNSGFRWNQPLDGAQARSCSCAKRSSHSHITSSRRGRWKLGDRTHDAAPGRKRVALAAGVDAEHFGRLHQVHGADGSRIQRDERVPGGAIPTADIAITDDERVAVAVQTADCLPLLLASIDSVAWWRRRTPDGGLAAHVPAAAIGRDERRLRHGSARSARGCGPGHRRLLLRGGRDVRATFADGRLHARAARSLVQP